MLKEKKEKQTHKNNVLLLGGYFPLGCEKNSNLCRKQKEALSPGKWSPGPRVEDDFQRVFGYEQLQGNINESSASVIQQRASFSYKQCSFRLKIHTYIFFKF